MIIDLKNFTWYERLRILRAVKGITSQDEAAELCGTNQKVYWTWESGKHKPRKNSQKAIASAFGVNVNDIFGE